MKLLVVLGRRFMRGVMVAVNSKSVIALKKNDNEKDCLS